MIHASRILHFTSDRFNSARCYATVRNSGSEGKMANLPRDWKKVCDCYVLVTRDKIIFCCLYGKGCDRAGIIKRGGGGYVAKVAETAEVAGTPRCWRRTQYFWRDLFQLWQGHMHDNSSDGNGEEIDNFLLLLDSRRNFQVNDIWMIVFLWSDSYVATCFNGNIALLGLASSSKGAWSFTDTHMSTWYVNFQKCYSGIVLSCELWCYKTRWVVESCSPWRDMQLRHVWAGKIKMSIVYYTLA